MGKRKLKLRLYVKILDFAETMFWLFFTVAIVGGWGLNLYKLTKADFREPYKTEVIRCIGIIVGWMDIGEEKQGEPK